MVTLSGCSLSGQRQKLRNPSKRFCKEQESKKMASVYLGLRLLHGLQVSHVTSILFTLFTTTSSSPRRLTRAQLSVSLHASQRHITVDKRANVAQLDKRARVWLIRRKETRPRLAHCRQWKTSQVFATESERKDRRFDTEEALESGDTYIAGEAVPVRGLHKGSRPMGTMVDGEALPPRCTSPPARLLM